MHLTFFKQALDIAATSQEEGQGRALGDRRV